MSILTTGRNLQTTKPKKLSLVKNCIIQMNECYVRLSRHLDIFRVILMRVDTVRAYNATGNVAIIRTFRLRERWLEEQLLLSDDAIAL